MAVTLLGILTSRYPLLADRMVLTGSANSTTVEIPFHCDRYTAWITKDLEQGYIVGVNGFHNHYDFATPEKNLSLALEELDDILGEQLAAVGIRSDTDHYMLELLPLEVALKSFGNEKPRIEIHTLNREH